MVCLRHCVEELIIACCNYYRTVVTAAVGELENVALRCEYNNSKNPDIASSPYIRTFYDAIGSFEEDVHQDSTATENPPCLVFEWMETDLRSLSSLQYRDGSPIPKIISKSVLSALESFKRNNIIHTGRHSASCISINNE